MKRAALYSAIFHGLVLLLLIIGLPDPFHRPLSEQRPIMVEFVNIDNFTQAPVLAPLDVQEPDMTEQQPAPNPEPTPEPLPEPVMLDPKPEVAPPEPEPEPVVLQPQPEPTPEPLLMPEHKVEEKTKPEPEKKPEPKPEKPKKEEKKPTDKPKEKEKVELNLDPNKKKTQQKKKDTKKKIDDAFEDMLNEIVDENEKPKKSSKSGGKTKGAPAERVGDAITASEIDAIRNQISKCWIVPNGVQGARDMAVKLDLKILKNGTVVETKFPERGRMSDPVYKAVAESAQRAALDPNCNPLPLNPANYEQWKEIRLKFDPKDMY